MYRSMNQLQSSVWRLFKEYFVRSDFVERATCVTALGMHRVLKELVERIERRLEQFDT